MAILIDKTKRVLVQGITGREGQARARLMLDYGTHLVGGVTPGKGGQTTLGVPVFNITAVKRNESVTIQASNFPANTKFDVTIGAFGTLGVGGTVITSTLSGTGAFTATYKIPAAWANAERLAIRLQSAAAGYYSYNWFWNFTTN